MSGDTMEAVLTPVVPASANWGGAVLPPCPAGQPLATMLHGEIPPHARLDMHRHGGIHADKVLRGALTVVSVNGAGRTVPAGEGIVEMVGTLHCGGNRCDEPLEPVMFYAGCEGMPLTEKTGKPL